jgi:hypothetical protein
MCILVSGWGQQSPHLPLPRGCDREVADVREGAVQLLSQSGRTWWYCLTRALGDSMEGLFREDGVEGASCKDFLRRQMGWGCEGLGERYMCVHWHTCKHTCVHMYICHAQHMDTCQTRTHTTQRMCAMHTMPCAHACIAQTRVQCMHTTHTHTRADFYRAVGGFFAPEIFPLS